MSTKPVVTLVKIRMGKTSKGADGEVCGDGGRYYYLPGADKDQTVKALTKAGFKMGEGLLRTVESAERDLGAPCP